MTSSRSRPPRTRDAERSRRAILDAAETLFSERGFDGVSLSDIGAASGLSRATPSYFFGSKDQLYTAVLERVFADRQAATAEAVAPVLDWCEQGGDLDALQAALTEAVDGYLRFVLARRAFVRFIGWESLAGGERLRATPRRSTALTDAFTALQRVGPERGLREFRVDDAVLAWVMLTFGALGHQDTLLAELRRDLSDDATRRRHVAFVVDQLMALLA